MAPKGDAKETPPALLTNPLRSPFTSQWHVESREISAETAKLRAQLAAAQRERERLLNEPRRRNEWPGLAGELLIKNPPPPPRAVGAVARLRAAIDNGWIGSNPSRETIDALRGLDREVLWLALHLDSHADTLQARISRDLRKRRAVERRHSKALAAFRRAVDGLAETTPDRRRVPIERTTDIADAITVVENAMILALDDARLWCQMLESYAADIETKARPHAASRWRGHQLAWLLEALRQNAARGRPWTLLRLAKLILKSSEDFVISPCPKLVEKYAGNEEGLTNAIKKQIAKAGKIRGRASSRNRKTGPLH